MFLPLGKQIKYKLKSLSWLCSIEYLA
jgi:hypothetical protein